MHLSYTDKALNTEVTNARTGSSRDARAITKGSGSIERDNCSSTTAFLTVITRHYL